MTIKNQIKSSIKILSDPYNEFVKLEDKSFEKVLGDYLKMLIAVSLLSSVANIIYVILRAGYLDIFRKIDIEYMRMINYSASNSVAIVFLYIFFGTFILLILAAIAYYITGMKFINVLKIMFYSLTPLLLFGWIIPLIPGLVVWSLFIFLIGLKENRSCRKARKGTIHERD